MDLAVEEFLRYHLARAVHEAALRSQGCRSRRRSFAERRADHADAGGREHGPACKCATRKLDLARKPNRHVAFGTGIHFCLGHQLARIEGRCALKALFKRWPDLQLAIDEPEIRWRERPGMKAIERLPVMA